MKNQNPGGREVLLYKVIEVMLPFPVLSLFILLILILYASV